MSTPCGKFDLLLALDYNSSRLYPINNKSLKVLGLSPGGKMSKSTKPAIVTKAIPLIRANEASRLSFDFKDFFSNPKGVEEKLSFKAWARAGEVFPRGLNVTEDGVLKGVPARGAAKTDCYYFYLQASNGVCEPFSTEIQLLILPAKADDASDEEVEELGFVNQEFRELLEEVVANNLKQEIINNEKNQAWQDIASDLEVDQLESLLNRPITKADVYYLLERFAHFTLWNADDVSEPEGLEIVTLTGSSEKFTVYDRGSCLTTAPKSLFDHSRTLTDAINTAKSMAQEVTRRGWNVEFGGLDKMVSAAWVELNTAKEKLGHKVTIQHYQPSQQDHDLLTQARSMKPSQ